MSLRSIYCSRKGLIMRLFKEKKNDDCSITITAIPIGSIDDFHSLLTSLTRKINVPEIKGVIFNEPATIVFWADGSKTIVKCQKGDTYSKEVGLAMAIVKKVYGNNGNYNDLFAKWLKEE